MLLGSFYTGLSGLNANADALNVIGNNLANINTAGFKRSQANFGQIMSNTVRGISGAGNPKQVGLGVRTTEIVAKFEQGSIQSTGIKTNLAIQGEGFFQVSLNGNNAYTRSGNFGLNEEGFLVSASGGNVQGFVGTDANGLLDTSAGIGDIQIDLGQSAPPKATDLVRFITNLKADAADGDTYSTSMEVFDSKGVAHQLTVEFTYDGVGDQWNYVFTMPDGVGSATAPTQADGSIAFDANGVLAAVDGNPVAGLTANREILFDLGAGLQPLQFEFELLDFGGTTPTSFITGFGTTNNTGTLFQNGFGSGVLQDVDFDQDGTMIGFFDNGLTLELARVAIATFNNKAGLKQVDGGFYLSTAASGPASIDGEGTGGRGSILSSSLESSNVDIAEEFTALIIHQRGYQSNSRIITTADQLLQEALNLKR